MDFSQRTSMAAVRGLVLAIACVWAAAPAWSADNEKDAVLAANTQFYVALNQVFKGELASMKEVWSNAGDVSYMGPTGNYQHGWSAVLKDWEGQAALKLGGRVEATDIRAIVGQTLAVVTDYEMGENTNAGGKVERVKLRATNTFRKEHGKWKMVGHHTDVLPYLAK